MSNCKWNDISKLKTSSDKIPFPRLRTIDTLITWKRYKHKKNLHQQFAFTYKNSNLLNLPKVAYLKFWTQRTKHLHNLPPLDWRNFGGKMEGSISYRIEHCSCLWNEGLEHRKTEGKFPMLLISSENNRKKTSSQTSFFLSPSRGNEANDLGCCW